MTDVDRLYSKKGDFGLKKDRFCQVNIYFIDLIIDFTR